ncbi:hypothetical protein TVAG_136610 [Trichomonas vaginalis G3]|uniref:Phenylalanyl-tRNA synthetase domain-containing protein n=1 Tax=Trichomonas vaginalis (strain ATCC PRA-98 / G3) TaxID=412133 RepID=A2DJE3_TRIV3|nr:phenylalanyl-tRNA aminoacylation [Trichomonas vaginalis G3]EAY19530.1 hypothetical protein TVAG_136610 [Trichomonas vaginalis G3]KAI5519988.1 phenylalanyl-tRNA aminoacylation [Trichomonas vaginalis G3]|eukprot:XP_001580516.1 hypothetical protein [Trichomonas vaginalis G3]
MLADEFKATGELRPRKFFSIDRVYRNETLDATHLAEFHQVEGFIIDKNLSLGDLMRNIREFFSRIGLKIRLVSFFFGMRFNNLVMLNL